MIRRIITIMKKEVRQVSRDIRTLIALIFIPLFLLVMFGYAISMDVKHITMAVYDEDNSSISRDLVNSFINSAYFERVSTLDSPGEIDFDMASEKFKIAIVIPQDFSRNILLGESPSFQVIIDGSNSMIASTIVGYVNAITMNFSETIAKNKAFSRPQSQPGRPGHSFGNLNARKATKLPIDIRFRTWYNPELKSSYFLVPGLIAFIMVVTGVLSTSLSIVREKERGSMEQILVSPVSPAELIIGKTVPYVGITLITATGILIASYIFFGIAIKGSILLLFLCTLVFLLGSLGLGILISTLADSQQVAFMISALIIMLPTFILSGFVFPIRNMPFILQLVTYLIHARYFLVILRSIILKGAGFGAIWHELLGLAVFTILTLTLGIIRLSREMKT
ncbi:MAG: ABC transporter permease [Spirochaetales bacterium]|nr:ABC transporter permease [Spirochaetales bacterium]